MAMEMKEKIADQSKSQPGGLFAREISLWALLARGSIYKILAVLAIMISVEGALFYKSFSESAEWEFYKALSEITEWGSATGVKFERIFAYSGIDIVFLAGFCLVAIVLVRSQSETHGSRSGYTLRRLRITKRHLFWVMTVFNFLCFVLLFAVQIWAALFMCRLYREMAPAELVSPQLEFLAFYQTNLLHDLLPLADVIKWVKNLLTLLALSTVTANQSASNRWQSAALAMSIVVWWIVTGGIGIQSSELVVFIPLMLIIIVSALRGMGFWSSDKSAEEPR